MTALSHFRGRTCWLLRQTIPHLLEGKKVRVWCDSKTHSAHFRRQLKKHLASIDRQELYTNCAIFTYGLGMVHCFPPSRWLNEAFDNDARQARASTR